MDSLGSPHLAPGRLTQPWHAGWIDGRKVVRTESLWLNQGCGTRKRRKGTRHVTYPEVVRRGRVTTGFETCT